MRDHLDDEELSAMVDSEMDVQEAAKAGRHLEACRTCSARKQQLEYVVENLQSLPPPELSASEAARLRDSVLRAARVPRRRLRPPEPWLARRWLAAGLAAAAFFGIGLAIFRAPQDPPPAIVSASGPLELTSDRQLRRVVSGLSEVRSRVGRYTAEAADRQQGGSPETGQAARPAGPQAEEDGAADTRLSPPEAGSAGRALPAPLQEHAEEQPAGDTFAQNQAEKAADPGFSVSAGRECLQKVGRAQPGPVLPLAARRASYRGRAAWLLTYAWTRSPGPDAKLDRVRVWVLSPQDCSAFDGEALLGRALHVSSFEVRG